MAFNNWQSQLRKGMLDIVILNLLNQGSFHGYQISKILLEKMGMNIRAGNIYPILARLKKEQLVEDRIQPSEDGPPRKYFSLTAAGRVELDKMNIHLDETIGNIRSLRERSIL